MTSLTFSTGNSGKFATALQVCDQFGIKIVQLDADIDEIQSEDPQKVALDKAQKAYEKIKSPVIISDDSWSYPGLGGFPGVYMHSMNEWLSAEDFLRLILPLEDRRAIYTQYLVYQDNDTQKIFSTVHTGTLIKEIRGTTKHPSHAITAMDGEGGLTIAEVHNAGHRRADRDVADIWHEFAGWFLEYAKDDGN